MDDFHRSVLSEEQFEVLVKIGQTASKLDFYLAGGTALAIYFGHRRSVDLDWFTPTPLADPLNFAQLLRDEQVPFQTDTTMRGTVYGTVGNVRTSFIEYRYPLLQPPAFWKEGHCELASLDDLACMKLSAVAQRVLRKDFIDLFELVRRYLPLPDLLVLYRQKYQVENILPVLVGLAYFDDAETEPDPPLWPVGWDEVKRQITSWVMQIR